MQDGLNIGADATFAVVQSYMAIRRDALTLTRHFYQSLFARAPSVRALFADNLEMQHIKLTQTLAAVVDTLHAPEKLTAELHRLGQLHAKIGATPEHYELVADTLIESLALHRGNNWTDAESDAWRRLLCAMTREMLIGAEQHAA